MTDLGGDLVWREHHEGALDLLPAAIAAAPDVLHDDALDVAHEVACPRRSLIVRPVAPRVPALAVAADARAIRRRVALRTRVARVRGAADPSEDGGPGCRQEQEPDEVGGGWRGRQVWQGGTTGRT